MNWDIKEIHNYNEYMQKYSIHSLLAKIFAQRKYNEQDIQGHTSKRLIYHDFSLFLDADLVLDRIQEALENDEKICIYGDYDCDGILSTAILVQTFLELGKKVGYHIPNRFEDGYGLNKERVQQMYETGLPENVVKNFEMIHIPETNHLVMNINQVIDDKSIPLAMQNIELMENLIALNS